MEEEKFREQWNEIKRILEETGTPYFEISTRVVRLMDAIEAKDLTLILKELRVREQALLQQQDSTST
jgi:hypothetical protein